MNESVKVSSNDLLVAMLSGDLRGWSGRLPGDDSVRERILAAGSTTAMPIAQADDGDGERANPSDTSGTAPRRST